MCNSQPFCYKILGTQSVFNIKLFQTQQLNHYVKYCGNFIIRKNSKILQKLKHCNNKLKMHKREVVMSS